MYEIRNIRKNANLFTSIRSTNFVWPFLIKCILFVSISKNTIKIQKFYFLNKICLFNVCPRLSIHYFRLSTLQNRNIEKEKFHTKHEKKNLNTFYIDNRKQTNQNGIYIMQKLYWSKKFPFDNLFNNMTLYVWTPRPDNLFFTLQIWISQIFTDWFINLPFH